MYRIAMIASYPSRDREGVVLDPPRARLPFTSRSDVKGKGAVPDPSRDREEAVLSMDSTPYF